MKLSKLNSFLIILFILLKQISAQCYEPTDLFENKIKEVDCGEWVTENNIINDSNKLVEGNETMFQVVFTCLLQNQDSLCNKVQKSFDNAGKIISDTIKLKEKIIVNATFYDFCEGKSDLSCPIEIRRVIGGAGPNRFYSLLDDESTRIYPQALVKQFEFTDHPKYNDFDIIAIFNSRHPFHFNDDIAPINVLQYDFEYIITHELIHGLGFFGTWYPYDDPPKALFPVFHSDDVEQPPNNIEQMTFVESVFDKFIIRLDNGTSTSEYAKQINKYVLDTSINVTTSEFEQSYQFQLAKEMLRLATTPHSLGFLPHDSNNYSTDAVILETSIEPFRRGSSVYHLSLLTYNNTSDFLMMHRANVGKTLQDLVSIGGNYSGGVIGPKIKSILETIGYATEDYQNPPKPQPFAKQQPAPTATSSAFHVTVFFNQFHIIIFIIVMLIHDH